MTPMTSAFTATVISGLLGLLIVGHVFWPEIEEGALLRCLDAVDWLIERFERLRRKQAELETKLKELAQREKEAREGRGREPL